MPWGTNQSIQHPVGVNAYGSAVVRTEPDRALAEIGVARVAQTAKAAFAATRKGVEDVTSTLRRSSIPPEAVEVSRVTLTSAFEGFGQTQKFIGYRARVTFRVLIDQLDVVEAVIASAVEAGANEVTGVTYLTSQLRDLRARARREAVAAARRKAELYSEAAGVSLGQVVHIEDINPDTMAMRGGHGESTALELHDEDVEPGVLKSGSLIVSAAVMVSWALLSS